MSLTSGSTEIPAVFAIERLIMVGSAVHAPIRGPISKL